MKKINKLLYLVFSTTLLITSCNDFLEENPKYSTNTKTIFSTKSGAETVINNGYGELSNVYGIALPVATLGNGTLWGIDKRNNSVFIRNATLNSFAEESFFLENTWLGFYKVIAQSNYLIDGISQSSLPEDYKEYAIANAHFLRGIAYYKLANLFGKSIVITDPITSERLHSPISSRAESYKQAIKDLTYAEEHLNIKEGQEIVGRASKQSAQAYLAKCYWLMACHAQSENSADATELFNKAKTYGDLVINSGKFALENNFANLFKSHVGKSKESVFQLNFSNENGPKNRCTFYFGPQASFVNSGSKSWGSACMDRAFYDFHKGTYNDDPRIASTYLIKAKLVNGDIKYSYPLVSYTENGGSEEKIFDYTNAPILNNDRRNPEYDFSNIPKEVGEDLMKKVGKWSPWKDWFWSYNAKFADPNSNLEYDSKNMIIFRYADLLLLMADVENELGNTPKAVEYLNQVLSRARQSGGANATYPMDVNAGISQNDLREKIFFERMFEMAGETELYEDVRRRGPEYLQKVIDIHNNNHLVKYLISLQGNNPWKEYLINNGTTTNDFLKKNLVLPIPASEINYNEKVSQADQNFGY